MNHAPNQTSNHVRKIEKLKIAQLQNCNMVFYLPNIVTIKNDLIIEKTTKQQKKTTKTTLNSNRKLWQAKLM